MAPGPQQEQLEKLIDAALKCGDLQALALYVHQDPYEAAALNCSKLFLSKLDKLFSKGLDQKDVKSASLVFTVLYKCGKDLMLPGGQGLPGVIDQGLVKKMVHWFEKCRQLWIQCGSQRNETLLNLSECFFELLMAVHGACKDGTYKVTESFLYPIGQLAADPRIHIAVQKEAIRKFNIMLDKIPMELKKQRKILTSQEASDVMIKLANHIFEGGDYDLQVTLVEALCRIASSTQRKELSKRWFSMDYVANGFAKIRDYEFETDCRKFLNMVNGMQTDRRVYSYPCMEVYLDNHMLLKPSDDKLEEFWIDFNVGSRSTSFYFSLADTEDSQWETICITENEVQSYTVTEEDKMQVFNLKLSEVVIIGVVEGSNLTIYFSSCLDILRAVHSVYGHGKNTRFVGKKRTSVVKTTIQIVMDENSQSVVPESQISASQSEKSTAPYCLPAPPALAQMVTPAKSKMSEATTFITSSSGGSHGGSAISAAKPLRWGKERPSLDMVYSCDQEGQSGQLSTAAKTGHVTSRSSAVTLATAQQAGNTLCRSEQNGTLSSNRNKRRVSETVMPTQKEKSAQGAESGQVSYKHFHSDLTQRLQKVLNEGTSAPPLQEPGRQSEIREDCRDRSSASMCNAPLCVSKERQVKKKGRAKEKRKGQIAFKADASPAKASQANVMKATRVELPGASSSKEMRDAEVAGSMVKLISSHYKTLPQSTAKAEVHTDLQCFFPASVNRPVFDRSWVSAAKETRYVKRHLFSDTDTDYAMTEVSWVRESCRKPKPKVAKYSRQARDKPKTFAPDSSSESPDMVPPSSKPVKENTKLSKKKSCMKEAVVQPKKPPAGAPNRPTAASRRPQRAAASATKSYREPDTEDSQSEPEQLPVPKQKPRAFQKQKNEKMPRASTKLTKKNDFPVQEQTSALKDSWAARQACGSPSPIEKMRLKSAEMLPPTLDVACSPLLTPQGSPLPASPCLPLQDTPSPIQHKLHTAVSSKGKSKPSSCCSERFITSKTLSLHSAPSLSRTGQTLAKGPSAAQISPVEALLSVLQSPFLLPSQPLLASTGLRLDKSSVPSPLQSPSLGDTFGHRLHYDFSKVSPMSHISLSNSSTKSSSPSRVKGNTSAAQAVAHKVEKTPSSDTKPKSVQSHRSGPSHKRHFSHSLSSNSEDDVKVEKKRSKFRGRHSARLKPRKLLEPSPEVSAEGEASQAVSSVHAGSSSYCEVEAQDIDEETELPTISGNTDDVFQQFGTELKKKFQGRCKMVEVYSKQSLKTVQQHMSSLNVEVSKYRTQRLEKVQQVLLEEIQNLEQESLLKNMEKDLATYWKKQSVAFSAYQQQEAKRYTNLKKTLENNVCPSLEHEQQIFTSQMCHMRKDMKSVQDRLVCEMQKGEIQTVKRGLHALFFPEGARF
ncbi:synaptonemal complex protein 2 [Genypterus blacodes]|uniref:synaptonemal complex protein 2 n=1 Tax=Genypterus blacodes TaxID=154954 RepID=UPI003F7638D7